MSTKLFDQLKLPSKPCHLKLAWCHGVTAVNEKSANLNCEISGIDNPSEKFSLDNVITMRKLTLPLQAQNPTELKKTFHFLKDIPIPAYDRQRPQILIGLQHKQLIKVIDSKSTMDCPIVAEKTPLGWTVSGQMQSSDANAGTLPGDVKPGTRITSSQHYQIKS
jgi:hypothetical protein